MSEVERRACEIAISKYCTGFGEVRNPQLDKFGCRSCSKLAMRRYWAPKGKASNDPKKDFPILYSDGITEGQLVVIKAKNGDGLWHGGYAPKKASEWKKIFLESRNAGKLASKEYKLFPIPESWKLGTDNPKNNKKENIEMKETDLDTLKKSPKAAPKVTKKAAPAAKATKASKPAKKSANGKGRLPEGEFFHPGTTRHGIYKAIADGKLHKIADLKAKFPKSSVKTELKWIGERGNRFKAFALHFKDDSVQLVTSKGKSKKTSKAKK